MTVSAAGDERASLHTTRVERRADGTAFHLGGELAAALSGEHFISLLGTHAVGNALLSLAPLAALGAPVGHMASRLAALRPEPHRLAPRRAGEVLLVDDSYNANPESVAAGIEVLEGLPATARTLVLGPMAELGRESVELHRAVAGRGRRGRDRSTRPRGGRALRGRAGGLRRGREGERSRGAPGCRPRRGRALCCSAAQRASPAARRSSSRRAVRPPSTSSSTRSRPASGSGARRRPEVTA